MARRRKKSPQILEKSLLKLPHQCKLTTCTALRVKLNEVAINNLVLRVPLMNQIVPFNCHEETPSNNQKKRASVKHETKKKLCSFERRSELVNGQKTFSLSLKPKLQTHYTFNYATIRPVQIRINLDLMELSDEVNILRLPSPSWQVLVMMKHDYSTAFKFSSSDPHKCVTFSQANPHCKIFMNGTPVILLGCPKSVDSRKEMEILLDIVHRLDFRDCMVAKL